MTTGPDITGAIRRAISSRASSRRIWLGLAFGAAVVAGLWLTVPPEEGEGRAVQLALAAIAVAGVLLSHRWPVLGATVAGVATGTAWLLGLTADPFVLTGFALLQVAERRGSSRFPWWMIAGALMVLVASLGLGADGVEDQFRALLLSTVVLSASWVLGVRTRQAQDGAAARTRAEERLRLARDVHDALSHSLGTIGVRAGVAAHVASLGEADLRVVLREIEDGARESLVDLKSLLQRERAAGSAATDEMAPASTRLTVLLTDVVRSAESTGLRADLDIDDSVNDLPVAVRSTAHRVVQEAVSNVVRHASASSLVVAARATDGRLHVQVRDDGSGAPEGMREGHGLTGMRERVALVGGTISIVAAPHFSITVTVPTAVTPAGVES